MRSAEARASMSKRSGRRPVEAGPRQSVAARSALRRGSGERQVGRSREVPRVGNPGPEEGRLEEPRVVVPHDLGRRDGRQVRGALVLAARAERLAEAEEDERAGEKGGENAEEEEGGLAGLGTRREPQQRPSARPLHVGASQRSASSATARPSSPRASRPPNAS